VAARVCGGGLGPAVDSIGAPKVRCTSMPRLRLLPMALGTGLHTHKDSDRLIICYNHHSAPVKHNADGPLKMESRRAGEGEASGPLILWWANFRKMPTSVFLADQSR